VHDKLSGFLSAPKALARVGNVYARTLHDGMQTVCHDFEVVIGSQAKCLWDVESRHLSTNQS
jgi:hypothetical protein